MLFEEVAFHDAKEADKQEREARRSAGNARTNSGSDGSWVEQTIGDDDEVDWKEASLLEAEQEEE